MGTIPSDQERNVIDLDPLEFERICKNAVLNREDVPSAPSFLCIDRNGNIYRKYKADGKIEFIDL